MEICDRSKHFLNLNQDAKDDLFNELTVDGTIKALCLDNEQIQLQGMEKSEEFIRFNIKIFKCSSDNIPEGISCPSFAQSTENINDDIINKSFVYIRQT